MKIKKIILLAITIIIPFFSFAEENYILKEGDEIKISLQNISDFKDNFQIDKEGYVSLPEVGKLKISNLNLEEAKNKLISELSNFFKDSELLNVEVTSKNKYIFVLGYVANPTEILLSDKENIQIAISKAGGVKQGAQLNKLQIKRDNGESIVFNYKKYLDSGKEESLPELNTLDTIFVPASPLIGNVQAEFNLESIRAESGSSDVKNAVTVFGEVHKPGIYTFKEDQSLVEYIMKAGGVTRYGDVAKIRVISGDTPKIFNLKYYLDSGSNEKLVDIIRGSTIYVPIMDKDIEKTGTQVFLMGEIKNAGVYEIKENTTFIDVVGSAGGPSRFADTTQIKIIRQDGNVIEFNLNNYVNNIGNENIPDLFAGDVILFPEKASYAESAWLKIPSNKAVQVLGAVNNPGRFPWADEMSIIDLIAHAEGPTQQADLERVKILTYGKYGEPHVKYFNFNTILKEGVDFSNLPKIKAGFTIVFEELPHDPTDNKSKWIRQSADRSVYVFGAVKASGRYAFDEHMSFLDIFAAVEGPSADADLNAIQIVHRNSYKTDVETFDFGLYMMTGDETLLPKIKMGDTIFVPYNSTKSFNKNSENTIKVMGNINRTGVYKYNDDMTIIDVLADTEGFKDGALLDKIIIVNMSCCETSRSYSFDFEGFMEDPDYVKLPVLRPGDIIFVPSKDRGAWESFMNTVRDAVLIASLLALVGVI
jgi:protein involved in polysaccharide export with SLBB domain